MSLKNLMALVLSISLVIGTVLTGGCVSNEPTTIETPTRTIKDITTQEAFDLIQDNQDNPDFVILDVRTAAEFAEGHIENAENIGNYALQRLGRMMERYEIIGAVRGLGLLMGMELVKNRQTKESATEAAEQMMYGALSKGLSFKVTMGNIITLTPPLTISRQEMDQALDILDKCLRELQHS